ncbi:ribosomal RNA processing protein 1 homolog B [Echinops telfairi]|uniref:Ribosomal RNA processing protein 1 homolog B n=1 Tax=Echinops telfairi TaxID=9371 RepID=A0AC55CQF0_ECHTE|nr:ribosomal RNA processing protein 1 homolog B [Echinops telfairi]
MAPAMQPAEIQFAQRLASNEKSIRDRAVKKLRQYISVKTQGEAGGFSQEELLKIWKGLFYCMWVQGEPLLQEELGNRISQLVHVVNNSEAQHLFLQTFWQTMNREWAGIDKLCLDKYCMLMRLVLRQSFEVLKQSGWEESGIKRFLDVLMKEVLHPEGQAPSGVKFHFIDIYLDELSKVGGKELLADQNLKFIDPFCKIAAKSKDQTLVQTIARGVFDVIVDQSPFIPEEVMEGQRTKGGDGELSEEEIAENEGTTWRKISKKKTGRHHSRKDGISADRERESGVAAEDAGPQLQFDYKAVADRLLESTRKNIPPFNRKCLARLIKKFQDLSEGRAPQLAVTEGASADEDGLLTSHGGNTKKGNKPAEKTHLGNEKGSTCVRAEEEENGGSTPRRKRKKKKKNPPQPESLHPAPSITSSGERGSQEPGDSHRKEEKVPSVVKTGPEASSTEQGAWERPPAITTCNKRKRPRKKSLRAQEGVLRFAGPPPENRTPSSPNLDCAQAPAGHSPAMGGAQGLKRKRKLSVNGSSLSVLAWPPTGKGSAESSPGEAGAGQRGRLKKKKGMPGLCALYAMSSPKAALLKKRRKVKERLHLAEHNGVLEPGAKQTRTLGNGGAFSPLKKKTKLRVENDFVKFDTPSLPKPVFFRKAKSTASPSCLSPTVQLNKTPSSAKKVTFGLNRNMTAEFKKTDKSILVSPTGPSRVAFNPEQKPLHGVLKTPTSSPSSTPLTPKTLLASPPKRRPTAMDFF